MSVTPAVGPLGTPATPPPSAEVIEQVSAKAPPGKELLLSAWNIQKLFPVRGGLLSSRIGDVRAVDGVSLDLRRAETVGLVGESGCGKTTLGRLMLRLIEPTKGHTFYLDPDKHPDPAIGERLGQIYAELEGLAPAGVVDRYEALRKEPKAQPLLKELDALANRFSIYRKRPSEMRQLRGRMQIVFQDPFSSLSPRMLVRDIVSEPLAVHGVGSRKERYARVAELLASVGLNPEHVWRFPHEFSGGQRQRIGIARALALRPDFIVLDEPTSALDVSVQAQILNILLRLQREQHLSYLFISHHLSVVRVVSHRVVVMYLGKVVERAETEELFENPLHPYTQALLSAIPIPDPTLKRERIILSGDVPSPAAPPSGCRFHTRCPKVMPVCSKVEPPLLPQGKPDHLVACHLYSPTSMMGMGLIGSQAPPIFEIPALAPISAGGGPSPAVVSFSDLQMDPPASPPSSMAELEMPEAPQSSVPEPEPPTPEPVAEPEPILPEPAVSTPEPLPSPPPPAWNPPPAMPEPPAAAPPTPPLPPPPPPPSPAPAAVPPVASPPPSTAPAVGRGRFGSATYAAPPPRPTPAPVSAPSVPPPTPPATSGRRAGFAAFASAPPPAAPAPAAPTSAPSAWRAVPTAQPPIASEAPPVAPDDSSPLPGRSADATPNPPTWRTGSLSESSLDPSAGPDAPVGRRRPRTPDGADPPAP